MGQSIEVKSVLLGDVAVFDTDRSVSGQDGEGFASRAAAQDGTTTAARLAAEVFGSGAAINHVYVLSNEVTVRRSGGWSDEDAAETAAVIRNFFIFYQENRGGPADTSDV